MVFAVVQRAAQRKPSRHRLHSLLNVSIVGVAKLLAQVRFLAPSRRRLVLAIREAPLSEIHLENMLKLSRMGVVICPPMPAFYTKPATLDDLVTYSAVRLLDQFDIHIDVPRWDGDMEVKGKT